VRRCLAGLTNSGVDISTIAAAITSPEERDSPHVVKALVPLGGEREVAFARDFLRQLPQDTPPPWWHHIGIYAYHRASLERFVKLAPSAREKERSLEQMRALDSGMKIAVVRVDAVPLGVDTPADLERARQILRDRR
jgi:3-deoxy-manno-octulosonate cytidylyltransferase (CMP-KDO synthetase)